MNSRFRDGYRPSRVSFVTGASQFCSPARNWSFEFWGRRQEAEGKSQKEGARRSIFTNMRCSLCNFRKKLIHGMNQLFAWCYKRLFRISGENGSVSLWLTPAFGLVPREVLFLLSAKTQESRGFSNPYWQFTASVPSATLIFGKLRDLTGLSPREPIQSLLFQLIHACPHYKYWLLCHLSMVWCICPIKLTQEAIGHQYCRHQLSSKRINSLFSIACGNGSVSLWLTQAFGLFPQEVLFLLSPKTHQSLTKLTIKRAYGNAEILNSYLYSATPVFREWQKRDSS